jgi:hypothetical protein
MSDFVLIDLFSQRKEVLAYVQNWTATDILDWMKQHGTVVKMTNSTDDHRYGFISHSGLFTGFLLSMDKGLEIVNPR